MDQFFIGIRLPNKRFERLSLNIDVEQNVFNLREKIASKIEVQKDEIELIYCGILLEDDKKIKDVEIKPGSTVHVFPKTTTWESYDAPKSYKDDDYKRIAKLFDSVAGLSLNINTRMTILQKILTEYPEFRRNLGAQSLIRDSVLFQSLKKPEVIARVAQDYAIICDAADFIVKTIKREAKQEVMTFSEGSVSDLTSSSEEDSSSNSTSQTEQARIRQISRDQLAAALMLAGSASLNSLSNIAQRNSTIAEEQQQSQLNPPSSSSSNSSNTGRITSSLFNNALNQALLTSNQPRNTQQSQVMDTMDTETPQSLDASNVDARSRFATELQIMREMGLSDANVNLQALILSNGEVEAAINLVFSGMHNLFN